MQRRQMDWSIAAHATDAEADVATPASAAQLSKKIRSMICSEPHPLISQKGGAVQLDVTAVLY